MHKLKYLFLFFFSILTVNTLQAVPNQISYQGVLNDANGDPVNSTVDMTFKLYSVASGGTVLWNETQTVQVSNGIFNVKLGSVQIIPASIRQNNDLYLGINVGADSEMTPRQPILATIYDRSAVPVGTIQAWAKSMPNMPELPEEWIECNGQTLNDPESPFNGQVIPNLNGENRFLRGDSTSGNIGGSDSHQHFSPVHMWGNDNTVYLGGFNTVYPHPGANLSLTQSNNILLRTTSTSNGSINGNVNYDMTYSFKTSSGANQPLYYSVLWIMKVK